MTNEDAWLLNAAPVTANIVIGVRCVRCFRVFDICV